MLKHENDFPHLICEKKDSKVKFTVERLIEFI